jgi:hypothetical protein
LKIKRALTVLGLAAALTVGVAGTALAGSPHFVDGTVTATRTGDTLTVSGKEAGLGDETQIRTARRTSPWIWSQCSSRPAPRQ